MQASGVPPKFPIPWASSAGSAAIRAIPVASQIGVQAGAASLTDGFVPLNLIQVAAGGVPPFGQDMNGILNQITEWEQWQQAGGPVRYDAAFVASIGGYPAGAMLLSNSGHAVYENLVDNNTADPNTTGVTSWRIMSCTWSAAAVTATGSANSQIISLAPAPTSLNQLIGIPLWINSVGINTGAVIITPNGLGSVGVTNPGGIPLSSGQLSTRDPFGVIYNGVTFVMTTHNNVFTDPGSAGITIRGTTANGGNLQIIGDGNTTPNKSIRVRGGNLEFVSSDYTRVLASIQDNGTITSAGGLAATTGALGSSNLNVVPILADFLYSPSTTNAVIGWPNSTRLLVFSASIPGGAGTTNIVFPSFFLTQCNSVMVCFDGNSPPGISGSLSAAPLNVTACSVTSSFASGGPWGITIWAVGS